MNRFIIAGVVGIVGVVGFLTAAPGAHAQDAGEIRFAKGADTGAVTGEVTATIQTYRFRARKDQRVVAVLEPAGGDKGTLTMTLYRYCGEQYGTPLANEVLRWEGALPCTDRYTIDVAPSPDAIKTARVQRYKLTLTIR